MERVAERGRVIKRGHMHVKAGLIIDDGRKLKDYIN